MQALIVQSHFYLIVLYVVMTMCFAPEWVGTFFQNPEKGAVRRDRGSYAAVLISLSVGISVAFSCAFGVAATTIAWHQPLQFWVGVALMLAGTAFRWYAIRVLGKFFTRSVATRPGQYVVDTGPYRLIRHPSYSGSLLTLLGMGLAMTNWLSVAGVVLCGLIGYGYRVHVEERALCADLGESYRAYRQRTWRFVPFVW